MTGFLRFFRRFPQINVGGDSTHFPSLEDAPMSLASVARKRVGCDTLVFNGEGYHFWKTCIQIFIEAIDLNIWEAIEIGSFIPTMVVGNETIEKPREE